MSILLISAALLHTMVPMLQLRNRRSAQQPENHLALMHLKHGHQF